MRTLTPPPGMYLIERPDWEVMERCERYGIEPHEVEGLNPFWLTAVMFKLQRHKRDAPKKNGGSNE